MSEEDVLAYENDELHQDQRRRRAEETRHEYRPKQHHPWYYRHLAYLSDDNINAFSGATAGIASGVAVCPLDVAKTRLQAQGGFSALMRTKDPNARVLMKYFGLTGTLSTIWKEEGVRGLYRGLVPIVIGYLPTWMVYFFLYEKSKSVLLSRSRHCQQHPFMAHILSALTAGSCSTLITNPIWVVKTRLMSQNANSTWHYKSTFDAFRTMYKQEGIQVFYSGLGPALLGLSHVAVQFPLYEKFKSSMTGKDKSEFANNMGILAASGMSKVAASSITYPHEVIRTRNQIQPNGMLQHRATTKYRGIVRTAKVVFMEEGWRAFYAGLGTNMFRAVPSSAVTLFTYELVSRHLKGCRDEALCEI